MVLKDEEIILNDDEMVLNDEEIILNDNEMEPKKYSGFKNSQFHTLKGINQ